MTSRVLFVWRARISEEYSVSSECSDAGTTWRLVPMMGAYSNLELAGLGDKMTGRLPSVAIGAISRTAIAAANCTAVMSAFPRLCYYYAPTSGRVPYHLFHHPSKCVTMSLIFATQC